MPQKPAAWQEPSRSTPLRWGTYADRYLAGLALIFAGTIGLQGANPYIIWLLLAGTVAVLVGWAILPARGWRRIVTMGPGMGAIWILLTGPQSVWSLTIPFVCWLVVRHRPLVSYVTLLLPLASGVILPGLVHEYSGMPRALAISAAVLIASAWLARLIAVQSSRWGRRDLPLPSKVL